MLREVRIKNFAVVESVTAPFAPGLNVLTGETGAGKSILIDAILLVRGARAQTDVIRADAETATDADFDAIAGVVAHEYFHNWSGNRVTCRDWFQLSLKEGFTVFRDQQFSADQGSATAWPGSPRPSGGRSCSAPRRSRSCSRTRRT